MKNKIMLSTYSDIDYTIFYLPDNEVTPFVAAWGYNKEGNYWSQGHYFRTLDDTMTFIRERKGEYPGISWHRMAEIAGCALSYLMDNGELEDFAEDRYLEFSDEERGFFEIYEVDDFWDDDPEDPDDDWEYDEDDDDDEDIILEYAL